MNFSLKHTDQNMHKQDLSGGECNGFLDLVRAGLAHYMTIVRLQRRRRHNDRPLNSLEKKESRNDGK